MIDNEALYHLMKSEMLFSRAVVSFMAALVMYCGEYNRRDVMMYLILYASYNLARSFHEYVEGSA